MSLSTTSGMSHQDWPNLLQNDIYWTDIKAFKIVLHNDENVIKKHYQHQTHCQNIVLEKKNMHIKLIFFHLFSDIADQSRSNSGWVWSEGR